MKLLPLLAVTLVALASQAGAKTFQKTISLSCGGSQCNGKFPKVPQGKTLVVKTVSCFIDYSSGPVDATGFVTDGSGSSPFRQAFPLTLTSEGFAVSGVVPAAMTVAAGKSATATIVIPVFSSVALGQCSLRGALN